MNGHLDAVVLTFEEQWREQPPPSLLEFATDASPEIVRELVLVDLERRYRSRAARLCDELGHRPRLEDYARLLSDSGNFWAPIPLDVAEEYRVRSIWGDRPGHAHFDMRFPHFSDELTGLLRAVDREQHFESPPATVRQSNFDERAPLRYEDFEIQQMLGTGATGKVYRARQRSLDRMVAIKALHKRLQFEGWAVEAFLRESRILAGLDHPNIARLLGVGRFPGGGYFQVMMLVDGVSLRSSIRGKCRWAAIEIKSIVNGIAIALAHAHSHGVVHCDLKPENVLLSNGRPIVIDFGMAYVLNAGARSSIGGTPAYASPEVLAGHEVTPAADVWSLGQIWREIGLHGESADPGEHDALAQQCLAESPSKRPSIDQIIARTQI